MAKQNELDGLSRHIRARARRRMRYLRLWWRADKANGYRNRTATAVQVTARIKADDPAAEVSKTSLFKWEAAVRNGGMAALADRPKGPQKHEAE